MVKFRMKSRPVKPVRGSLNLSVNANYLSLREIIADIESKLKTLKYDTSKINLIDLIEIESSFYDGTRANLEITQCPQAWSDELVRYQDKLDKYNQWLIDHKEDIKAHNLSKNEAKKKRLKAKKDKMEKDLAKLNKQLGE